MLPECATPAMGTICGCWKGEPICCGSTCPLIAWCPCGPHCGCCCICPICPICICP